MSVERILVSEGDEVGLYFFLAGVLARPVVVGLKGVRVEVREDYITPLAKGIVWLGRGRVGAPSQQQPG